MAKLAPEWVRTSDPVIRSPARYRWTTAPAWKPGQIPDEDDIALIKQHIMDRFKVLTTDPFNRRSSSAYVELRDLAVARLTIYNARRGGEPARLQLREWKEAEDDVCVNREEIEETCDNFTKTTKLAYQKK